jgi:hypothetical protein
MPDAGAWIFNASFGTTNPQPKACSWQDSVIDLDARDIRRVDVGQHIRFVIAPIGPRDGSAAPVVQLIQQRRGAPGATAVTARFRPVPGATGDVAAALFQQLSDPATQEARMEAVRVRFAGATQPEAGERFYLRCEK